MNDKARLQWLIKLDGSEKVTVNDWEAKFLESTIDMDHAFFSPKQRDVISKLMEKYDSRL